MLPKRISYSAADDAQLLRYMPQSNTAAHKFQELEQIYAGLCSLQRVPFQVQDIVSLSIGMLQQMIAAQKSNVKIQVHVVGEPLGILFADKAKIERMLELVLENAVSFTSQGAILMIFDQTRIDEQFAALRVKIIDSGVGIPAEIYQNIFEPFFQGTLRLTRRHHGLGLGLTVVKSLAELLGAQIAVESHVGVGSTFCLDFTLERGKTL